MKLKKENWKKVKLEEVCTRCQCINYRKQSGLFNYIDIGSVDSNLKRVKEVQEVDWAGASSRARQIVKKGDTLFSTVRVNLERIAYLENELERGIASTGFTIIRPNEKILSEFLFYSTITPRFIEKISQLQKGTAYPAVTDKIVFNEEIYLPPIDEQQKIASLFQSIEKAHEQIEGQEKNLTTLKKQLLRDLFSSNQKLGNYLTKQDFEPVRFEKLALNISERVEPKETYLDTYVGLEHLDSDCLTIERTGKPEDVIGTKLKIYKDDIIFGKRRAYLRKVAVSHFDGIASAHSMILRANGKNIEKEFLPYFMQSDTFMERAVQISEGSLSPTIKWKTLAAQEFVLPKNEKQYRLVEIFKQFDTTTNLLKQQISTLRTLKHNLLNEILG